MNIFLDNTLEKWVEDHSCYVYILDNNNKLHEMKMSDNYANDFTWTADIPEGITNIRFARYNPAQDDLDKPMEWNYWEAGTLGSCSTYYAIGHSAGLWSTNFTPQTVTIFDGTNNCWLRGSNEAEFKVKYTVTDGNGVSQNMDYKMSYVHELNRYSIIIPKNVTQLSFHRVNQDMTETGHNWTNLNRSSNYFFNITGVNKGYWSTRYIYINDNANLKQGAGFGAYFYSSSAGTNQWTGMHSKSPSGYYVAVVPSGIDQGVVYTRYTSVSSWTNPEPAWTSMHNQTLNTLENFGSNNMFKTTGWTGDNNKYINGSWSHTSE